VSNNIVLEMMNIEKSFPGVKALQDVSISLHQGMVLSVVGENGAGKSTLIKILSGLYKMDSGKILINGEEVEINRPKDAELHGISVIHQELNLFPNMSIAENIFVGREFSKHIFYDNKTTNIEAKKYLEAVGLEVDVTTLVKDLTIAQRQMVEIAKALSIQSKVIVMDEPTSSLTKWETEILLDIVKKLKQRGTSVIYISHKLNEVFEISDRIVVLRDGKYVGTLNEGEFSEDKLITMMVGRSFEDFYEKISLKPKEIVLEARNIKVGNFVRDASFFVRSGEVLGFAGLVGAGRSELLSAIFGIGSIDKGEVFVSGEKVTINHPVKAIELGLGLVPEDRALQGLILGMTVRENITLANLREVSHLGVIKRELEEAIAIEYIEKLSIRTPSSNQQARYLSGGNQQKSVLAKWLATSPKVLILDEPTRGVDVGAKKEIYNLMNKLVSSGVAIIMISSELPEIIGMSDRIIVMHEGEVKGELLQKEATQEKIMTMILN